MTDTAESWRYIPDCDSMYAVSDLGRVYSYVSNKLLKPGRMPGGHMSVAIHGRSRCVHELVLISFVGLAPHKHEARHLNGVPSDNSLGNLEWATKGRNRQDKKWHDGQINYKLSVENVRNIKEALRFGVRKEHLAIAYGVVPNTITNIQRGKTHVDV